MIVRVVPFVLLSACGAVREPPPTAPAAQAPRAAMARAAGSACAAPRAICEAASHVRARVRWASDPDVWGVAQHWATPAETYAAGAGDCEDLALLVRLELVSRGVSPGRIAVRYGYLESPDFHVWLTVRDERGRRWIVSNAEVRPGVG